MLDKSKSYKFVGGQFAERTAEELARLEQLKAKQAAREPAKKWMPRPQGRFVMVTLEQAARLIELDPVCSPLFIVLLLESFRARGKAFILPTRDLNTIRGLSPRNLQRVLARLEGCGLISVKRQGPPKPPLVTIL